MEKAKDKILEDAICVAIENEKEKIFYKKLCAVLMCIIAACMFLKK